MLEKQLFVCVIFLIPSFLLCSLAGILLGLTLSSSTFFTLFIYLYVDIFLFYSMGYNTRLSLFILRFIVPDLARTSPFGIAHFFLLPWGMRHFGSLTKDLIWAPYIGSLELTIGLPGKSLSVVFFLFFFFFCHSGMSHHFLSIS